MNVNDMRHTENVLEITALDVIYDARIGSVHAVQDVNLVIPRGTVLGLAGESGCGKSTLAYAIAQLLQPPARITNGSIIYHPSPQHGKPNPPPLDILHLTSAQLRAFRWSELAIVFQSAMNALNPVLTIETQIHDVLRAHQPRISMADCKQRAEVLFRQVGIAPDRLKSYSHELSGGMRQRAVIAIALALSPEIIIMDEPTTALDVVVQREILAELLELQQQQHFTVIFITHDLSLLLELADTIAIMYAGRIVEFATSDDLYHAPRHPYTNGLLNSFPSLHESLQPMMGIPGSPPDLRYLPRGCAFHPRCTFAGDVCRTLVPVLQSIPQDTTTTHVACHLFDGTLTPHLTTEISENPV